MPVLNPFLRALFQSSVLGQSLPSQNYVLLVPSTESLLYGHDQENGKKYSEQVEDEDFLGSHILRISPSPVAGKDTSVRDTKGKAKTYSTVNGRTVIIKENTVYGNKGFKLMIQAQLLSDALYHSPANDMQQWLMYYISKPLVGSFEALPIKPAMLNIRPSNDPKPVNLEGQASQPRKKVVKTFNDLLNNFPLIAKQMQPGLERLFNEFGKELGRPLPPPPSRSPTSTSLDGTTQASEAGSIRSNGSIRLPFNLPSFFEDEEDHMCKALETAVTAAIDLFQVVDKQQLSYLGATTDLTGPTVERLIERYVAESVHDSLLFPRVCAFHRLQDQELDQRIRQMESLDVSQVGIAFEDGQAGKRDLLNRINRGVMAFRRMGVAGSPQEMLDVLLATQKAVSELESSQAGIVVDPEKRAATLTINADVLVSLLLLVVIRSHIRHLQARLSYMQRFVYIEDVESGEIGYALSTLEAVLTYLAKDASGLRKASKQNQSLWNAVKSGNISGIQAIFESTDTAAIDDDQAENQDGHAILSRMNTSNSHNAELERSDPISQTPSREGSLAHVFPFQALQMGTSSPVKVKKRVHMDSRSMSVSSSISLLSRATTIGTSLSGIEGDTSLQSLARTQDSSGSSILMMAVESQQPESLEYVLSLEQFYSLEDVLNDTASEGQTLLSAAIQIGNMKVVETLLDYLHQRLSNEGFKEYFSKTDSRGRSAAHYVFNTPMLITKFARIIPWRQRDRIGHTPLFAICRTYDHIDYSSMVSEALVAARNAQHDNLPLSVDDHTDIKGNSLLHIVNEPTIMHRILQNCDVDPNVMNDRKFTPLMLASKYGRIDMVRIFFGDPRIDLYLREARGLTAVELAKDDDVRNKIDDLTLFSGVSSSDTIDSADRITSIVRSFFVEDGSTRFIVKSGAPNSAASSTTYTITTSRRSLVDFENLAKCLSMDHPASYIPKISASAFRTPFQLHSRPSRAVLSNTQTYLDRFLKILIEHPTFSTHEMLWEFFLVPEMLPEQVMARAKLKAELIQEKIADEYDPMTTTAELLDVDSLTSHSREIVRKLNVNTRSIIKRGHIYTQAQSDFADAFTLAAIALSTFSPPATSLPQSHADIFKRFASLMHTEPMSSPLASYIASLTSFYSTITAVQSALLRPSTLITQIISTQKSLDRNRSSLVSNSQPRKGIMNLNLPGMEESRLRSIKESEVKITECELEVEKLGKELRYTQGMVVGELAGWTTWREQWGKQEIKKLVRSTIVHERERLKAMQRALRVLNISNRPTD